MSVVTEKPFSHICSNPGHYDRWTCPGCYADMPNKKPGTYDCRECKRVVVCSRSIHPVCVATLTTEAGDAAD